MTEQHDDGGPAFPSIAPEFTGISSDGEERYENGPTGGMTLRDYFAAKAMQAYMTSQPSDFGDTDDLARWSFKVADALLKARSA